MAKHRRKKVSKAAVVGTAIAATVGVGLTPTVANAVSSNTYMIGFPEWLPIGQGMTLDSDADAVEAALRNAKDTDPLIGWGSGGVDLNPVWVGWYDPTKDQSYTPSVENPAWTAAYNQSKADLIAADKDTILASPTLKYTVDIKTLPEFNWVPSWAWGSVPASVRYQTVTVPNPFLNNEAALDDVLNGGTYNATYPISVKVLGKTVTANVPYNVNLSNFNLTTKNYDQLARDEVAEQGIPESIPGYWSTTTSGQWVSPTDDVTQLTDLNVGDLGGLASGNGVDLTSFLGMTPKDIAYYASGDLGFLAPLLNWTLYAKNVNLIAYGDGAIATGEGYRRYIEAVQNGEIKAGAPLTDGIRLQISTDENNNPVVHAVSTKDGQVWDIPLPGDSSIAYPGMPVDEHGNPIYPEYIETPGGVIDITLITLTLLRNPGRPNGGLYARFAPIYQEVTGVNPVSPERTDVLYGLPPDTVTKLMNGDTSGVKLDDLKNLQVFLNDANGKPMVVTIKTDATWEYDILSDAPVTANPVAWANSLMSSMMVLTYGSELVNMAAGKPGSGVGVVAYTVPAGEYDAGTIYATLTTESLPLLAPARLIAGLVSVATGEDVNTPVADALEPMLRLLVDTSYTDAVRNEDGTWSRTLTEMHVPTLFGTQTLTRQQAALLAGDLIAALGKGGGSEYTDVVQRMTTRVVKFLEDNDIQVPTELKTAAAKLATEPGAAIRTVSREVGDGVSEVLGKLDTALPEGPAAPTQKQLADVQRPVGKVLAAANTATGGVAAKQVTAALNDPVSVVTNTGKQLSTGVTKQLTKTQKSLTHAQERVTKVTDKLKSGDVGGAVKQVGENVKNRVDRAAKDVNNGLNKLKGTDS